MKKRLILFVFMLFSVITYGQSNQTHLPASKTIVGIWRQTGATQNGKLVDVISGNYKVLNPDGTYFTFVTWGMRDESKNTTIGQFGTYKTTSDSTLVEHVVKHVIHPPSNGKDNLLKFRLIDENTMIMAWSPGDKTWVDEKWSRLPLSMP